MPLCPAEITPRLLIPPEKLATSPTRMPDDNAAIVPVLVTPPPTELSPNTSTLVTKMPLLAERVPALLMPPPNVGVNSTATALLPAKILPWLPMATPPETTPPVLTRMPRPLVALIVPLSTMAPLMVAFAIQMPVRVLEMTLLFRNPPLRKVLLMIVTPPGPDRTGIGDAAAEGRGADHHRIGVAAELGRIWPLRMPLAPSKGVIARPGATCRSRSPGLLPRRQLRRSLPPCRPASA